jgi:hypothetical protein
MKITPTLPLRITPVDHDREIRTVEKCIDALGVGDSITEFHTGSGEDNYVAMMFRHSDKEKMLELANRWTTGTVVKLSICLLTMGFCLGFMVCEILATL